MNRKLYIIPLCVGLLVFVTGCIKDKVFEPTPPATHGVVAITPAPALPAGTV